MQPSAESTSALSDELFVTELDAREVGPQRTLDLDHAPMVRLGLLANRYRQLTSQQLLDDPQIGATDWRVMVVIAHSPGVSVADVAAFIRLDKAAVSRSISAMHSKGLVTDESIYAEGQRQRWHLTTRGVETHDAALEASLELNRVALDGFDEQEVSTLLGMLDRMLLNLDVDPDDNVVS